MSQTIKAISAASHYAASASFWEARAKILQDQLDDALNRISELEGAGAEPAEKPEASEEPKP